MQRDLVKILKDKVKNSIFGPDIANSSLPSSTVNEFIFALISVREKIRGNIEEARRYNNAMQTNTNADYNNKGTDINFSQNKRQKLDNHSNQNRNNSEKKTNPCYICGRNGHPTKKCPLKEHPDRNQEFGIPFKDSTKGIQWKSNENGGQHGLLHYTLELDGTPYHRAGDQNGTPNYRAGDQNQQRREEGNRQENRGDNQGRGHGNGRSRGGYSGRGRSNPNQGRGGFQGRGRGNFNSHYGPHN